MSTTIKVEKVENVENSPPDPPPHGTINSANSNSNPYAGLMGSLDMKNIPTDELMGSVACSSDTDGVVEGKVRTSARVIKKMRFESELLEKKAERIKDEKLESKNEENITSANKGDIIIKKCVSPFWTSEEKNAFFEALNDYGKDFENIHNFIVSRMSTKLKRKPMVGEYLKKSKHQIRHFYYKTFHFISSYVTFSEKLPKNVQELYALINYGAIRRKLGSVSKLSCLKLSDLIYSGTISVKYKGKTVRVKTPMCKALRRLNKLDEKYDDLKLPTRLILELRPKNMASFLKVQSIAQNPRIKMSVSLQKRLTTVLKCIATRWKTAEALMYEKSLIPSKYTKDLVPNEQLISDAEFLLTPPLRLRPSPDAHIELPAIDINDYFTGQSICLSAYEVRVGLKEPIKHEEELPPPEYNPPELNLLEQPPSPSPPPAPLEVKVASEMSMDEPEMITTVNSQQRKRRLEAIHQGWTSLECESLTVGELYLMFGEDSRLVLEYSWDEPLLKLKPNGCRQENQCYRDTGYDTVNTLAEPMRKLLSLAKLQMAKVTEVKCQCQCGGATAASGHQTVFKRPLATAPARSKSRQSIDSHVSDEKHRMAKQAQNAKMLQMITQIHAMKNGKLRRESRGRAQLVVERHLVPGEFDANSKIVSMNIVKSSPHQCQSDDDEYEDDEDDESDFEEHYKHFRRKNLNRAESELSRINRQQQQGSPLNGYFTGGGLRSASASPLPANILKILRENDSQWDCNNSDIGDYSLSSLLGNLGSESVDKVNPDVVSTSSSSSGSIEDSQLAIDVDAHVDKLLMESSSDFVKNFEDLAEQVADIKK